MITKEQFKFFKDCIQHSNLIDKINENCYGIYVGNQYFSISNTRNPAVITMINSQIEMPEDDENVLTLLLLCSNKLEDNYKNKLKIDIENIRKELNKQKKDKNVTNN